jgi:hypothetical protein
LGKTVEFCEKGGLLKNQERNMKNNLGELLWFDVKQRIGILNTKMFFSTKIDEKDNALVKHKTRF